MRDRYKSEVERAQESLKTAVTAGGGGGGAEHRGALERSQAQVRELLEEKEEGLAAFKEMEAAALRLQGQYYAQYRTCGRHFCCKWLSWHSVWCNAW